MALSHEDKKDVAGAMGKAIANKVSKVTKDYPNPNHRKSTDGARIKRASSDMTKGNYVKLKYSSDKHQSSLSGTPISARGDKSGTTHRFTAKRPSDISKHPLHTQRDIMKRDPKGDYKHGLK